MIGQSAAKLLKRQKKVHRLSRKGVHFIIAIIWKWWHGLLSLFMQTKKTNYKVYRLLHPDTLEVKYVGVTVNSLSQRLSHHVYTAKNRRGTIVSKWIWSVLQIGKRPIIELIENCTPENWQEREIYWVTHYPDLHNQSKGGLGVIVDRTISSVQRSADAHKIKIVQLNKDGSFVAIHDSIVEAAESVGSTKSAIGNVLKGRSVHSAGYHWVYADRYDADYIIPELKASKCMIPLHQYTGSGEYLKSFGSVAAALKTVNGNHKQLNRHMSKGIDYCGFVWSYDKYDYFVNKL